MQRLQAHPYLLSGSIFKFVAYSLSPQNLSNIFFVLSSDKVTGCFQSAISELNQI